MRTPRNVETGKSNSTEIVRPAGVHEAPAITRLLQSCGLKSDDILISGTCYLVATVGDDLVGTVGIEGYGQPACLVRSLAVAPHVRRHGIGGRLMLAATRAACRAGARSIFLFSTGAGDYYRRLGYHEVPVADLVTTVGPLPQIREYERIGWLATEVAWRKDTKQQE